jgi:hypothetical protein
MSFSGTHGSLISLLYLEMSRRRKQKEAEAEQYNLAGPAEFIRSFK